MATYTYDDFVKRAQQAGMIDQFSSYDLDLARQYPEFGLSMLSLKQNYAGANTEQARLLANEEANRLRSSYGNYTGGRGGAGASISPTGCLRPAFAAGMRMRWMRRCAG